MGMTADPGIYNAILCLVCHGAGRIAKFPSGFSVCKECGGFGLLLKGNTEISEDAEDSSSRQPWAEKIDTDWGRRKAMIQSIGDTAGMCGSF